VKILLLDIETAPNEVHVWGLWNQNIGLPQILTSGYILCWAAKWLGPGEIVFDSIYKSGRKTMLRRIHRLLEQTDAVVHYNGKKFDIPTLNKEFLLADLQPPAPYRQIDLLSVCRSQFRFPSNKLQYVASALGLSVKKKRVDHELWINCMKGDPAAWKHMEEYNIQDVRVLEQVYQRLIPWIKNHPNYGQHKEDGLVCTNCGSKNYHRRGYAHTKGYTYPRFQCSDCGTWLRGSKVVIRNKETLRGL